VAAALTIHPFMFSKWRRDVHDGLQVRYTIQAVIHPCRPSISFVVRSLTFVIGITQGAQ